MSEEYAGRRGGYISQYDTYSTWKNNVGKLFDNPTRADAGWLNDGDYGRAFKGYPSHKTINIFIDGGYSAPSWKSTLIGGVVGIGVQALGLWAISGLFKSKKSKAQTTTNFTFNSGLLENYIANFRKTSFGLSSTTGLNNSIYNPNLYNNNNNNNDNNNIKTKQKRNKTDDDNKKTNLKAKATLTNNKINSESITGEISEIGSNNKHKYPGYFKITDKTHSETNPTVYTLTFVSIENDNKVKYKISNINYHSVNDKSKDIVVGHEFIINAENITSGEAGTSGEIKNTITGYTDANSATISKSSELGNGTKRTTN